MADQQDPSPPPDDRKVRSAAEAQKEQDILDYWTQQRQKEAQPLPLAKRKPGKPVSPEPAEPGGPPVCEDEAD